MTELIKRLLSHIAPAQLTREQWFELARQRMVALALDGDITGRIDETMIDILEHARRAGWPPARTVDTLRTCWLIGSNEMLQHYCVDVWGMQVELAADTVTLH